MFNLRQWAVVLNFSTPSDNIQHWSWKFWDFSPHSAPMLFFVWWSLIFCNNQDWWFSLYFPKYTGTLCLILNQKPSKVDNYFLSAIITLWKSGIRVQKLYFSEMSHSGNHEVCCGRLLQFIHWSFKYETTSLWQTICVYIKQTDPTFCSYITKSFISQDNDEQSSQILMEAKCKIPLEICNFFLHYSGFHNVLQETCTFHEESCTPELKIL